MKILRTKILWGKNQNYYAKLMQMIYLFVWNLKSSGTAPIARAWPTSHGLKPYSHYLQSLTKQNFKNHWKYHNRLFLHLWKSITWEAAEFLKRKALGKNLYTIWRAPYIHQFHLCLLCFSFSCFLALHSWCVLVIFSSCYTFTFDYFYANFKFKVEGTSLTCLHHHPLQHYKTLELYIFCFLSFQFCCHLVSIMNF